MAATLNHLSQRRKSQSIASYLFLSNLFLVLSLFAFPQLARAKGELQHNISNSWFKPSISVNNDSSICTPLLNGYSNSFQSQLENPLHADVYGNRVPTSSVGIITEQLNEIPWEEFKSGDSVLRVAKFQVSGKYFAVVRRDYAIGWREGFHHEILITKPFLEYKVPENNYSEYFEENNLGVFVRAGKSNDFRLIYKNDTEWKDYQSHTYAELVNIYQKDGSVYLLFEQQNSYLLLKLLDQKQLSLTCELISTPTQTQINAQADKLSSVTALKATLLKMIGAPCNEGTLHPLSNAIGALVDAFNVMTYRPWRLNSSENSRQMIEEDLELWGHSGIWQFTEYTNYLSQISKAEEELGGVYAKSFSLPVSEAKQLAYSTVSIALTAGFAHGRFTDAAHEFHKRLLNGTVSKEDLTKIKFDANTQDESDASSEKEESLLTFAIAHPQLLSLLLDKGANPNEQNWFGKTPLMYAAQFNQTESASVLLAHGAQIELSTVKTSLSCIDINHLTALHYAVRYASKNFIRLLLQHGVPKFAENSKGHTPFDYLTGYENKHLTTADREKLKVDLLPPDDQQKKALSKKENQMAEKLYGEKKLHEAYLSSKKALMLDSANESALSNLALIALKLDKSGESAKASSELIKKTNSIDIKANALFNLGLACLTSRYGQIDFDGDSYCNVGRYYRPGNSSVDNSALSNFLASYQLKPTKDRLNAVLRVFQDDGTPDNNRRCIFGDTVTGIYTVHFNSLSWFFLVDANKSVPFNKVSGMFSNGEQSLVIHSKETIPQTDTLKIERWYMEQGFYMPTYMDNMVCVPTLLKAYDRNTKLVAVFPESNAENSNPKNSSIRDTPYKNVTINLTNTTPIILFIYGHNTEFSFNGDLSNIRAIYMHGNSIVTLPESSNIQIVREAEKESLSTRVDFPNAMGFRVQHLTGLPLSSIVNMGSEGSITLSDKTIAENSRSN